MRKETRVFLSAQPHNHFSASPRAQGGRGKQSTLFLPFAAQERVLVAINTSTCMESHFDLKKKLDILYECMPFSRRQASFTSDKKRICVTFRACESGANSAIGERTGKEFMVHQSFL